MRISVSVNTYTHSVTYVSDNILRSLQDIVRLSGLSPENLANQWASIDLALKTWMKSQHLEKVILEVYDPGTSKLVRRWDLNLDYAWTGSGDGRFWVDTEQIKAAIRKAGYWSSTCHYDIIMSNKPGHPDVDGWGPCAFRSTEGFIKQSLGSTIEHCGLGASASYYRKKPC